MLEAQYGVGSDIYSVTSFNELARNGADATRWNLLHPDATPRQGFAEVALSGDLPVIAATDYMRAYSEQIRPYIKADYHVLGTDGFGRSDRRDRLRDFFEVDRRYVTLAALYSLQQRQSISAEVVRQARNDLGIDADKPNPRIS